MGEDDELLNSIKSGEGKVYFAVRNEDGTYGELQEMNGLTEIEIDDEADPAAQDLQVIWEKVSSSASELSATIQGEVVIIIDESVGYLEAMRQAMLEAFSSEDKIVVSKIKDLFEAIPKSPPSRSGFRPHRKPWESDKDDPSTFGAYMSKKHRKKRR